MTTTEQELKERQARLERGDATDRRPAGHEHQVAPPAPGEPLDQEHLLAWLKVEGLVRDPTPDERRLAAEWETLPEREKQAHIGSMHGLILDVPLSQIVMENRR